MSPHLGQVRRPAPFLLGLVVIPAIMALAVPAAAGAQESAQAPDAPWRTLSTPHFRVHYPAPSEAWARRAAGRLESVWAEVEKEVGYTPPDRVDVVVSDPVAEPNGAALPFLGWPRIILWTSPPGPESIIGHYADWGELLLVHEGTHLVHMLRPSRNPVSQFLAPLLPVGPITLRAPRWVTEGYATVVEGRLTGSGRPNGDLRAAILRRRAQRGKLPSYGSLDDDESWIGSSMAYLMGSAFLEWLDQNAGGKSLPKLWARMTARERRSFDDAFEGVYGGKPDELYGRFTAELTHSALEAERALAPVAREGDLWQDLSWTTGAPALSPGGDLMAIVLRGKDDPAELVVWDTGPDEEAEKEWQEERERLLKRDPEDVPAVRVKPLAREPLYRLPTVDGVAPATPRFLPDGDAVLFVRFEPDGRGFLHPDLFRWDLPGLEEGAPGRVVRLTRGADLREPDPGPDGTWAVAIRRRDGMSQVVRVDLATGAVAPVTTSSLDEVYDQPRVSPDGKQVAFALHRAGGLWRLAVRDLASGAQIGLAPPSPGATVASPAWSPDGRKLYALVGEGGFIDAWAFSLDGSPPVRVTRVQGAAFAPAPTPDGQALFFLALEPDGLDLRRLALVDEAGKPLPPAPDAPALAASLAPAITPPRPPPPPPFAEGQVPPGRPYGLGRQELLVLAGGRATSAGSTAELGVRVGDIVGRLDLLALGSPGGDGSPQGGTLALAWRGLPVALSLAGFDASENPSRQAGGLPPPDTRFLALDLDRRGAELRAAWERRVGPGEIDLEGGGLWDHVEPDRGVDIDESIAFAEAGWAAEPSRGKWSLSTLLWGHGEHGQGSGDSWTRAGGALGLGIGHEDDALTVTWRRDDSSGTFRPFQLFQVGGTESSLLPRSALMQRIEVPALPAGTLQGFEYEGQRAELALDFIPVPLFYERHRVGDGAGNFGGWLSLAGLEWTYELTPQPLARIPAVDLRVGVARVLDSPLPDRHFEGDTRWWLTVLLRP